MTFSPEDALPSEVYELVWAYIHITSSLTNEAIGAGVLELGAPVWLIETPDPKALDWCSTVICRRLLGGNQNLPLFSSNDIYNALRDDLAGHYPTGSPEATLAFDNNISQYAQLVGNLGPGNGDEYTVMWQELTLLHSLTFAKNIPPHAFVASRDNRDAFLKLSRTPESLARTDTQQPDRGPAEWLTDVLHGRIRLALMSNLGHAPSPAEIGAALLELTPNHTDVMEAVTKAIQSQINEIIFRIWGVAPTFDE